MNDSNLDLSLLIQSDNNEMYECAKYVLLREGNSMEAVATELGMSRATLYRRLAQWNSDGTMEKVREILIAPRLEVIQAKLDEILQKWPEALERVWSILKHSKSDHVSLEAFQILRSYIDPALEGRTEAGAEELAYAKSGGLVDPTSINADFKVIAVRPNSKGKNNSPRHRVEGKK